MSTQHRQIFPILVLATLSTALGWAYWPTILELIETYGREPDYSHGYFILPLAGYFLWARRDLLADVTIRPSLWGFLPLALSFGMRYAGTTLFIDALVHLSIVVWLFGVTLLFGGPQLLRWALPALAFTVFLFPIPFRMESWFSAPLQSFATTASCWLLQLAGQAAYATGNVINIGDNKIEVVHACNGLRMIVSFLALCAAYSIVTTRGATEKALIVAAALPIAVCCNVLRITATGFFYQYATAEWAQKFTHDVAGWLMMVVALVMLQAGLWYFDRLFVETEVTESTFLLRRAT